MEWVETTAKTVEEAKELALDQLGVAVDDAEFEILESPRAGLFGRLRGEARVRARVRPAIVRPKIDRRKGRRVRGEQSASTDGSGVADAPPAGAEDEGDPNPPSGDRPERRAAGASRGGSSRRNRRSGRPRASGDGGATDGRPRPVDAAASSEPSPPAGAPSHPTDPSSPTPQRTAVMEHDRDQPTADVADVRDAAVAFVRGLTDAFGVDASVAAAVDGTDIDVRVDGAGLGVLIGPGGRTLLSIQDLARVAAQRRLHDHDTRLRVDVSGYREKRRAALERFAGTVAEQVLATGVARSLDPMPSADRKVIHDALAAIDGVVSRSEGEEPERRVVVAPAG